MRRLIAVLFAAFAFALLYAALADLTRASTATVQAPAAEAS